MTLAEVFHPPFFFLPHFPSLFHLRNNFLSSNLLLFPIFLFVSLSIPLLVLILLLLL